MILVLTVVLFALGLFQTGLTSVIQSVETVEEAVGEDALLSCQILQSENVLQVDWLKQTLVGLRYLAYSDISGSEVIPYFRGKVEVKDGGLHNSSIVIKNVTEEDVGCYLCLFITNPAGALTGRTCLKVYELHEPVLHVRESNSTDEFLVSCSATGRPAPTVTLNLTQQDFYLSQNQTVVINTNATFTVTATAVLAGFHDAGTRVGCAVQVLSRRKEAFVEIPDVKVTPPNGTTSVIQSVETVEEAVGEDALLSCQTLLSEHVEHVTWQKQTLDEVTNLATSNTIHGSRVMSDFRGKVEVKDGGLNSRSIVIKNVTEEDEGCYLCLFITKPAGALPGRTCLRVYELHEPVLHVRESNSTDEFMVSCSATGRPAPTVTLNITQQDFYLSQNQTVVINTNGTFTVTVTAVLAGFHDAGTRVGCAVQVLSCRKEAFVEIPDVKVTPPNGLDEGSGSAAFIGTWIAVVTCLCAASVLAVLLIRKQRSRSFSPSHLDLEMTEVPQTADADTVKVPLFTPEKTPPPSESKQLKETDPESSSTARRPQSDQLSHRDQEKTEVPQTADADTVQVPFFTPEKSWPKRGVPPSKMGKKKATDPESSSTARRTQCDQLSLRDQEKTEVPQTSDADTVKVALFTPVKTPPPSESKQRKETDLESSSTARSTQSDQLSHRDQEKTEVPQTADADTVQVPFFTPEKSWPKRGVPPSKMGKKKATHPESSSTARRTQCDQSFRLSHRDQEKTEVPQTAEADTVKEPLFTPEKSPVREQSPPSESKQLKEADPESSSTARRTQSDQLSLRDQEKTEVPQTSDADTVKVALFTPVKTPPPSESKQRKETDLESSSTARRTQSDQSFRLSHRDHEKTEVPQTADADTVQVPFFTPEKSWPKRGVPPSKMGKKKATDPESSSTARRTQCDQSFRLSHRDHEMTEVPQTADADTVKEPLFTPEKSRPKRGVPPSKMGKKKATDPESSSKARRTKFYQSFSPSHLDLEMTEVPQTADADTVKVPLFTPEKTPPPSESKQLKETDPESSSTARRTQSDQSFRLSLRDQEKTEVPQTADADTVKIPLFTPEKSRPKRGVPPSKLGKKKETDPESSSTARRIIYDKSFRLSHRDQEKTEVPQTADADTVQVSLFTLGKSSVREHSPPSKLMKNKATDPESSARARRRQYDKDRAGKSSVRKLTSSSELMRNKETDLESSSPARRLQYDQ